MHNVFFERLIFVGRLLIDKTEKNKGIFMEHWANAKFF